MTTSIKAELIEAGFSRNIPVLKNIALDLKDNETVLVLGRSGSGKTTLLLALTGVLPNLLNGYVKGRIALKHLNPLTHDGFINVSKIVGVVLQDPDKQIAMPTPYDEVAFTLENLGYDTEEIYEIVQTILKRFNLLEKAYEESENLSGGEKRKLTLAASIVHNPSILLIDEPTASMDPWGIREVRKYISEYSEADKTIVVVEHKARYFIDLADRVILLKNGHITGMWKRDELDSNIISYLQNEGIDSRYPSIHYRKKKSFGKTLLITRSLSVGYHNNSLIRYADIEVKEGEVVALVGPNGSGKTTLLKTISGLIDSIDGEVVVEGTDINNMKKRERYRYVFYVPQTPDYMFISSSVKEELNITCGLNNIPLGELSKEFPWYNELASKPPYRLSHGQRRWLSLAIAKGYKPKILLLDEPTSGLDLTLFNELKDWIEEFCNFGRSLIIATHDPRVIAEIADRTYLIEGSSLKEVSLSKALNYLEIAAGVI